MEVKVYFLEPKPGVYGGFREFLIECLKTVEGITLRKTTVEACQIVLFLGLGMQISFMKEDGLGRIRNVLEVFKKSKKRIVLLSANTEEEVSETFPGLLDFFISKELAPRKQAEVLAGFLKEHFQ